MNYVWIKDKLVHIHDSFLHFHDRGFYFGDGVYEVIRIYKGVPFLLKEHFECFSRSTKELDMPFPLSFDRLRHISNGLN